MANLIYKPLQNEEIPEIDRLNTIGSDSWKHEFFSSEKPNSHVVYCRDASTGDMIGCEGYVDYTLWHNGKCVQTHRSERTLINPMYRGQGIFEHLVTECDAIARQQHSHMVWGATAALKAFKRAGFNTFTGFRNYAFFPVPASTKEKFIALCSHLNLLNPTFLWKVWRKRDLDDLKNLLSLLAVIKPKKKAKININTGQYSESNSKKLLESLQDNGYAILPEQTLFNWLKHKGKEYQVVGLYLEQQYIGHAVYRLSEKNYLHLTDVFTPFPEYFTAILESLAMKEKESGALSIFLPLNASNGWHKLYIQQLKQSNILNLQKAGSFVIKTIGEQPAVHISQLMLTDLWLEL